MFSSKKGKDTKKRGEKSDDDVMKMFGLGMPDEDDEDDESLEAELAALQGRPVQKKKPKKKEEKLMSLDEIQALASSSLRDIDDDEDMDDEDLDDEDLLDELHELVPNEEDTESDAVPVKNLQSPPKVQSANVETGMVKLLAERRDLYLQAIVNAKSEGAQSKVRRYERGTKELEKLLKDAKAGKTVKEDDIPPPVFVKGAVSSPSEPTQVQVSHDNTEKASELVEKPVMKDEPVEAAPVESQRDTMATDSSKNETLKLLTTRRDEYKVAALAKKKEGDMAGAKHYFAVFKQFEPVINALEKGEDVDLSKLPPPPSQNEAKVDSQAPSIPPVSQPQASAAGDTSAPTKSASSEPPPPPSNVLEALQQRLEKYESAANQAKEEGNGSKARRMGRIVKQYQDAMRDYKKGKSVNYDELPCPPGYAPIPVPGGSQQQPQDATPVALETAAVATPVSVPQQHEKAEVEVKAGSGQPASRNQKELQFLLTRQKEFKMAALQAKKDGNIENAKDYLRKAKGMDEMIVAAQSGLRVDITTVPSLKKPSVAAEDSVGVQSVAIAEDWTNVLSSDAAELYGRLETALKLQIKTSKNNSNHYKLLGDLSAAKNFETLHKGSQQDLDTLTMSKLHGNPVPKFHYEMKSFPIVKSHPELSDSECEITIVRCINIPLPSGYQPKDMYSYVVYEFPFPNDSPQTGSSNVVKNTINPEFNQSFKVSIDRKSRALQRVLRRQPVSFKLMYQRGFLKSDKALGQANLKLENFSNRSMIHECVDLMDTDRGRKTVGGKIEVILKIREPLVDKDIEVVNEKWLVLDSHLRTLQMGTSSASAAENKVKSSPPSSQYKSVEVSKFEKDIFEKQIASYKSQGKKPPESLIEKLKICEMQLQDAQTILQKGGDTALEYMKQLKTGMEVEKAKAQTFLQSGNKTEAKVCLAKRKILEKEIASIRK